FYIIFLDSNNEVSIWSREKATKFYRNSFPFLKNIKKHPFLYRNGCFLGQTELHHSAHASDI
ncbi:hypothetical protein P9155_36125, partial [Bacillus cereus]|nr:hypothetical protein [Bacillus cereus]